LEVLNQFVAEADRKTEHAKRKLRETQEELGEEAARKVNQIGFSALIKMSFLDEFYS
jgi:hypothetical protein